MKVSAPPVNDKCMVEELTPRFDPCARVRSGRTFPRLSLDD
jgi:hypothetical protein